MSLIQRSPRPRRGDHVIVVSAGDAHESERAVVVQDDQDSQPYRLRFQDGTISSVFYREAQVRLADAILSPIPLPLMPAASAPGLPASSQGLRVKWDAANTENQATTPYERITGDGSEGLSEDQRDSLELERHDGPIDKGAASVVGE